MRASRLLSILIQLQARGRLNAQELARAFEVSVRTIYRDIDHLSAAGVPVYAERGRDGGFALHEGYRTRLTGFTPAEAEALLFAGVGDAAGALGVGAQALAAQLKLLASLPEAASLSAQRIQARFHVDPAPWYAGAETLPHLPQLAQAVWRDRRVRIVYESWNKTAAHALDPMGLVLKNGAWYLVAAARGRPLTFRAANIAALDVLDEKAQRPPRFDLARYWTAWAAAFEKTLFSSEARVRLSPQAMRDLRANRPLLAAAAARTQRPARPPGWIEADIPLEPGRQGVRALLALGAEAETLGPAPLRAAVAAEARRVAALHRARRD
ncbi:MAG: WYL domain-containing protein [Hyphomonadaceae bacterium]|nr:WYL domain-containing protein [Hyphomonadaceae bacterium]